MWKRVSNGETRDYNPRIFAARDIFTEGAPDMNTAAAAVRLSTALATFAAGTLAYFAFGTPHTSRTYTYAPRVEVSAAPAAPRTCAEKLRAYLGGTPSAEARTRLAGELEEEECYSEAETLLRDAVRLDPSYADAYYNLGYLYSELGRFEEAAEALEEGLRLDPDNAGMNGQLGFVLNALERPSQAVAPLTRDLRAEPEDAYVRASLSESFLQMRQHQTAYAYAREAVAHGGEGGDVPALDNAASTLLELARTDPGRAAEAEEALRKALESEPDGLYPNFMLGLVLAVEGRGAESEAAFRAAARAQPDEPFEYLMRGWAQLRLGRAREAAGDARRFLELVEWKGHNADDAAVLEYLALRRDGRDGEALEVLVEGTSRLDSSTFGAKLMMCLRDGLSEEKLFAAAKGEGELTAAHGYVGLKQAMDGEGLRAARNLKWVRTHGTRLFVAYAYVLADRDHLID